jgi:L-ribulose-5-phosphate 3-epimerase
VSNLCTLPLGLYEKAISNNLNWVQKLTLTRECGFDYLEVGIDATEARLSRLYSDAQAEELKNAVERTGVPVFTMALTANRDFPLGSENDTVRNIGMDIVAHGIDFASSVGIQVVHLAAYDEHGELCSGNTRRRFADAVEKYTGKADARGVKLALETMDEAFMGSCVNIAELCRKIGSAHLYCYADIGNLTASGLDVAEELAYAKEYIVGVHLKDARPGVYRDVLCGDGTVDFDVCLKALRDIGYSGYLAAEMWGYDRDSFHAYLPEACRFFRSRLCV